MHYQNENLGFVDLREERSALFDWAFALRVCRPSVTNLAADLQGPVGTDYMVAETVTEVRFRG